MYPNELFLEISLYEILIFVGLIISAIVFIILIRNKKIPKTTQYFYLGILLISVASGFVLAVVFQSLFDFLKTKELILAQSTFLGGFIGGSIVFRLLYKYQATSKQKGNLKIIINAIVPAILIGHFFGRIGCFFEGCCYGIKTNSTLGVQFPHLDYKVHPTQLYEGFVLLFLFTISIYVYKRDKNNLLLYLFGYGISRFMLEFLRGDERGQFILFFSPSQIMSLILICFGIYLVTNKRT